MIVMQERPAGLNGTRTTQAELVSRFKEGDEAACGELVATLKKSVYLLALRLTGHPEDAEDITQEAFLRAFLQRASIDPEKGLRQWLYKVTTNLCFNHQRARRRRWLSQRNLAHVAATGDRRNEMLLRVELQQALTELDLKSRAAIVLVWLQGLSHREAGEILGCSEGTVSWRVFKAKRRLRQILEPNLTLDDSNRTNGGDLR